jgi:tRNA nucleotidyltransferase (CCA-adding enzyme)
MLGRLVELLNQAGATGVNLVGGAVLDLLRGSEPKDLDVEVFGLTPQQIEQILIANGFPANTVGKSFGIIKTVFPDGTEVDLSVPRRENRIGSRHRDFQVSIDVTMTAREAARRRDLTINALAVDLRTGRLLNFFGGLSDFHRGLLRVVDPETFVEDPLRVLRIAQLLPRKGKRVDSLTLSLCRLLVPEFQALSAERVLEEFRKLLLKPAKPAKGLRFLERCGWLRWFPELDALRRVPQNRRWHPEGSVWNHTLLVVNRAASVRDRVPEEWREAFMWAALLHDVGKAVTTRPDLTSPGHDESGCPLAQAFLERLRAPKGLTSQVVQLVRLHMRPGQLHQAGASEGAWRRLARQVPLEVLGWLSWADSTSRPGFRKKDHGPSRRCFELAEKFASEPAEPVVRGRDLLALGFRPGPQFGAALKAAFERQLDGETSREVLLGTALEVLQAG